MDRSELDAAHSAAIRRHWRDLDDAGGIAGPGLLGDLAKVADQHAAGAPTAPLHVDGELTADAAGQLAAWIQKYPARFAAWSAAQQRTAGGDAHMAAGAAPRRRPRS